jgi:outer membrane receptor for ferrienterochelin and colicins
LQCAKAKAGKIILLDHSNFILLTIEYQPMKSFAFLFLPLLAVQNSLAQQTDSLRTIGEVTIKGAAKPVGRGEQIIPTEIVSASFFQKNPSPNILESLTMLNGIRPQLNCSVCNTGDIHINGMEGPYTMVLIDGMPIVSSLSTVYGFSSIPNSLIERLEIVKGPASAQYSPEAMGGMINIITKNASTASKLYADIWGSTWMEANADVAASLKINKKIGSLISASHYRYTQTTDHNKDGFTDMPVQERYSVFNKWEIQRPQGRIASIAGRYVFEDRWGGQTNWNPSMRGTELAYAEQIRTRRWELISAYRLPLKEIVTLRLSYNYHDQNSMYGTMPFIARQQVGFAQAGWEHQYNKHSLQAGSTIRYTHYDDNTVATLASDSISNRASVRTLSGIFIEDQWKPNKTLSLSMGYRADYDATHGWIHSPRLAIKYNPSYHHTFRIAAGNGFRVVNIFTEDHAALSGARTVEITEALLPEVSKNITANYLLKLPATWGMCTIDLSAFYTHFSNKIIGDYDTDPGKIIYRNLSGDALSRGSSLNTDFSFSFPMTLSAGITYMDVLTREQSGKTLVAKRQLFAPQFSGNILAGWTFNKKWSLDLSAKWEGPMRLPVVPNDFRPEYAPWRCIANLQCTRTFGKSWSIYGGIKNLFNTTPKDPILRPFDPFDKTVNDPVNNPKGYSFDPSYSYGSMQGIRGFFGIRYKM